jgi:hypothetical protein
MSSRPFIPAINTASVELIYLGGGVTAENIFHVRKSSPYSLADLQAVRALVITWWNATYKANITAGVSLVRVRTKALDTNSGATEDFTLSPASGGTNTGGINMPNGTSWCVKLATGLAGRSFRGRWYVFGLNGADVTMTEIGTTRANAIVSALTTLIANLAAAGHTVVIASFRNNNAWRSTATLTPVTGPVAVDLHLDSQRRRLAGRGQ